jgi:hypothetical protein
MEPARDPTPRWHYRYDNFHRAHSLLREVVELMQERALTPLEQEGAIQLPTVTPAAVLRAAQAAGVIGQGEGWMRTLDTRNKLARTYDFKAFAAALEAVRQEFLGLLDSLHGRLLDERFDKAGP